MAVALYPPWKSVNETGQIADVVSHRSFRIASTLIGKVSGRPVLGRALRATALLFLVLVALKLTGIYVHRGSSRRTRQVDDKDDDDDDVTRSRRVAR